MTTAEKLVKVLTEKKMTCATAESCTGGGVTLKAMSDGATKQGDDQPWTPICRNAQESFRMVAGFERF
jgi:hypothetical protein